MCNCFCRCTLKCDATNNNLCEALNGTICKARIKPLPIMLETSEQPHGKDVQEVSIDE